MSTQDRYDALKAALISGDLKEAGLQGIALLTALKAGGTTPTGGKLFYSGSAHGMGLLIAQINALL